MRSAFIRQNASKNPNGRETIYMSHYIVVTDEGRTEIGWGFMHFIH